MLSKCTILSRERSTTSATWIELTDSSVISAKRGIIVSAGAYQTPQVLQLGNWEKHELKPHRISQAVDLPLVGQNIWDHLLFGQSWKLRDLSSGVALGSKPPIYTEPQFGLGVTIDWLANTTVPADGLKSAIEQDDGKEPQQNHPLLKNVRCFNELLVTYIGVSPSNPVIPLDGSHITTSLMGSCKHQEVR